MDHSHRLSRKPEFLVKANRIDDERVAIPFTYGVTEERGCKTYLGSGGSAVHVDFAPAARPADEKENTVSPVILDEVDAVRCVESPWTAIPGTPWMRIVLPKAALPCQEQGHGTTV